MDYTSFDRTCIVISTDFNYSVGKVLNSNVKIEVMNEKTTLFIEVKYSVGQTEQNQNKLIKLASRRRRNPCVVKSRRIGKTEIVVVEMSSRACK